jgi:hypothetical protein
MTECAAAMEPSGFISTAGHCRIRPGRPDAVVTIDRTSAPPVSLYPHLYQLLARDC